jgi:hypothetical protein
MRQLTSTLVVGVLIFGIAPQATADRWQRECRGYSPAKTIKCIASKEDPPGGVSKALAVWHCESGWGTEPSHYDSYHGPFQYLYTTYTRQRSSMRLLVREYDLSPYVHDMRSNIIMAVGYAARNDWGPWSCA